MLLLAPILRLIGAGRKSIFDGWRGWGADIYQLT